MSYIVSHYSHPHLSYTVVCTTTSSDGHCLRDNLSFLVHNSVMKTCGFCDRNPTDLFQSCLEMDGHCNVLCSVCSDTTELLRVANLTIQDAFYAHKIMFELNVLPLAWQITNICGNVLVSPQLNPLKQPDMYISTIQHLYT